MRRRMREPPPTWLRRGLPLLVACLTAACFLPSLRSDFVFWDDDLNITGNRRYRGLSPAHLRWMFTTLHGGHYQPLSWLTLGTDYALWGMNATGYHLTSLVLHTATAVAVYALLLAVLDRRTWAAHAAAALGALFFAVHPLRVESVVWVTERRDVLSGLFFVLTLLAYLRMQRREGGARHRWLVASLAAFTLSLLSKAWGMTVPAVLLVLDAVPLGRLPGASRRERVRVVLEKLPWAVLAAGAGVIAFAAQHRIDAMRSFSEHGPLERMLQATYGLCFYLWKTLVPTSLSPLYILPDDLSVTSPRFAVPLALAVLVTVVAVLARRRWPWLLTAWVAYVAILSPVLGVAQTGPQVAADRYTYLASLPLAALFAAGVERLLAAMPRRAPLVLAAAAAVVGGYGIACARQTRVWHDSMSLWNHAIDVDAGNFVAWTNRGWTRQLSGDLAGAVADYSEALRLRPSYPLALNDRGFARQTQGDVAGAIADYTRALAADPRYAEAVYNRGTAHHGIGDLRAALADYTQAIALDPTDPRFPNNRGLVRRTLGDEAGAREDFRRALEVAAPDWEGRGVIEKNLAALDARGG
jgi:tetratricopeptide (TPR) repeat protein